MTRVSFSRQKLVPWILAVRPKTLTAAFVPIWVGCALGVLGGEVRWSLGVWALLSSLFIQIGTNLVNDASDFKKGADTSERVGPIRVTQSGMLSSSQVMLAAGVCFALAALFGLPLVLAGGWPILVIGLFSLLFGFLYTAGPYPLAYLGLGDLFVLIFFGWVAVGGMQWLVAREWSLSAWIAGTQVGLLATVLIAINNFRDSLTDQKANKKTLPVRFGARFARIEITTLVILPFLLGAYWWSKGTLWAAVFPFALFPLALRLVLSVWRTEPGVIFNQFLAQAAALHLGFGFFLGLGLIFGG